jgi:ACS family hexuronate transporter-like MFS transporter
MEKVIDRPQERPAGRIRWVVCSFLFAAIVLSYMDRLVIAVLKPDLAARYHWTDTGYADLVFWFQLAYGLGYVVAGRLIDRFGARLGYACAVTIWAVGHMLHAAFTTVGGLVFARIIMAAGESGAFPAALAATNEWFPARERAFAIGVFNAGSNVGAIVTPLVVPLVASAFGWRMAFVATGMLTLIWVVAWLAFYRRPRDHRSVSSAELQWIEADPVPPSRPVPLTQLLRQRPTWAFMIGRFLIDPIWWTFLFWLPDFFSRKFGLKLNEFGPPLVAIYLFADLGSVAGGWFSSRLMAHGRSANRSRKTAMLLAALCAVPIAFAARCPSVGAAVCLIGLACAGHQAFSANLYAMPGDLYPRSSAGSVVGLGGLAGALGSMALAKYAGIVLQALGSFEPIFLIASATYLVALTAIHIIVPDYRPVRPSEIDP